MQLNANDKRQLAKEAASEAGYDGNSPWRRQRVGHSLVSGGTSSPGVDSVNTTVQTGPRLSRGRYARRPVGQGSARVQNRSRTRRTAHSAPLLAADLSTSDVTFHSPAPSTHARYNSNTRQTPGGGGRGNSSFRSPPTDVSLGRTRTTLHLNTTNPNNTAKIVFKI